MAHPDFLENRLRESLVQLFGELEEATLAGVRAYFHWMDLPGGACLFRQGDAGDSTFILLSGRLRVSVERQPGRQENLGEIPHGELVGEMALITGEARSADVLAMRDSVLARISKPDFERLTRRYPQALPHIFKLILARLRENPGVQPAGKNITNLCLLPVSPGLDPEAFVAQLAPTLSAFGPVTVLNSAYIDEALQQPGIAQASLESPAYRRLTVWLSRQETTQRFVLYQPDAEDSEWTRRCLRQADEVLLIGDATQAPSLHFLEKKYLQGPKRLTLAGQTLALLHPPRTAMPTGTKAWLTERELTFRHHLRRDNLPDLARLGRFLSGNAVGLVLSGGAAKGFAHIGVFRALEEAGIPVDLVGGTSIGAIMGALVARGWKAGTVRSRCREVFKKNPTSDFNLVPRVSIFKGKKLEALLAENFGGLNIEDCWLNFFCISSNLSKSAPHVHRIGPLTQALRASISIPGIFPPAEFEKDLFVDGGVFNNMPVDVMSSLGAGKIVAVDLQTYRSPDGTDGNGADVRRRLPNLLFLVMQSSMLSGRYLAQQYREKVDLYFNPPLRGFSLIDWQKFDVIEEIGYQHARQVLKAQAAEDNF